MKIRLVTLKKDTLLYCKNGSILKVTEENLKRLFENFKNTNSFKGNDGFWNSNIADIEHAPGITIAYVDDTNKLVVLDSNIFKGLFKEEIQYLSATEYANKVGKSRPSIKNMCAAGRIPGAYKTSSGWLIPENAPYPKDGRCNNGGFHPTSKK